VLVPYGEQLAASRVVNFGLSFTSTATEAVIGHRRFVFARVSRGMAQNAALAIVLASELGVSDDAIQRALGDWSPAKWRGELRRDGERLLYLDCYNANPASMADALETFYAVTSDAQPRMLVLGCMEELGPDAPQHHRELGRSLKLRAGDQAFVIGGEAGAVIAGAIEAGLPGDRIKFVETLNPVAEAIAGFQGAVFIKGSRRHALEKALPPAGQQSAPPLPGRGATVVSGASCFPQAAAQTGGVSVSPFSSTRC
jgi:UDP-N-acetylmuramoyl-tripeptide--D-alanyl-D-alanine ligase